MAVTSGGTTWRDINSYHLDVTAQVKEDAGNLCQMILRTSSSEVKGTHNQCHVHITSRNYKLK